MLLVFFGRDYKTITDDEITKAAYIPIEREIKRLEDIKSGSLHLKQESNSKQNNNKDADKVQAQTFEEHKYRYDKVYELLNNNNELPKFESFRSHGVSGKPSFLILVTAILIVAGQYK